MIKSKIGMPGISYHEFWNFGFVALDSIEKSTLRFLVFLVIMLASCADNPPIPEKDFAEIYVQLHLIETRYAAQPSMQKTKVDSTMKAFKVSDSLVKSMLSWYSRRPERWREFFEQVQARMMRTAGSVDNSWRLWFHMAKSSRTCHIPILVSIMEV